MTGVVVKIAIIMFIGVLLLAQGLVLPASAPQPLSRAAEQAQKTHRARPAPAGPSTLTYHVRIEEPVIREVDGYHVVSIPGCSFIDDPGAPALPTRTVVIVLPPSSTLDHIEIQSVRSRELSGDYMVMPAPQPAALSEGAGHVEPDPEIYSQTEPYPGILYSYQPKIQRWCGFKLFFISLFPVQYVPAEGKLVFHEEFQITVYLTPDAPSTARTVETVIEQLRETVVNPEVLDEYDVAEASDPAYLIVTRPLFEDAANDLKELLEDRGYTVYVEYVDDIVNEYSGEDVPEKIRNCIKDYYQNHDVYYVLLLGDADPTDVDTGYQLDVDWEVPTRYVYNPDPDDGYDEYYTDLPNDLTPTDYYYAGLDGDWDGDGDGYYGESPDYSDTGSDEADWLAEVWVGRLPVRTAEEAEDYVAKLEDYLSGLKTRYKRMLLLGAHLFDSDPDDYTDGAWACEKAAEFFPPEVAKRRLYENEGNLTYSNVVSEINTYDPIFVCSASHGSTDKLWLYWTYDWFADTDLPDQVSGSGLIWYALACLSGAFDINETERGESFAEAMIRDSDGSSVAHLSSTRITWAYVGSYWFLRGLSGMHLWLFWYYMSVHGDYAGPGRVLYEYANPRYYYQWYSSMSAEWHRKVLFACMLCGDPSLPCSVGVAGYSGSQELGTGEKVPVYGYDFMENADISIYLQRLDWDTYEFERIFVDTTTTDEGGDFYTVIRIPSTVRIHTWYDFMVSDERGNFDHDGSIYIRAALFLTPDEGHGNFIVNATGIGFSANSTVELRMNNVLITTATTDEDGRFCVFFVVLTANPGIYEVRAIDENGCAAAALLYVVDVSPLSVQVDVGSIHFAGEVAEFYILTAFNGTRVNATIAGALLYHEGSMIADLTDSVEHVDTGLYRVSYTIPAGAEGGTYTLLVEAYYTTDVVESRGVAIRSFLVSPTLTGWNATLTAIQGDLAIVKTDVGYIKMSVDEINMTVYDIKGDTAYIRTEVGDMQADLDSLRAFLEDMNATLIGMLDNMTALIRACNATIMARIDVLNATLSDLILSARDEVLAELDTALGTILAELDLLNATIVDIKNDTAIVLSVLGEVEACLDALQGFLENMNATLIGMLNDTIALIRVCNATIMARLDALSAELTDLIETAKGDVLAEINTALGTLMARLDALNATILEIREDVARILTTVDEIKAIIESWTGTTATIYGCNALLLTTSVITEPVSVMDCVIKLVVSGPEGLRGSLVLVVPKALLERLGVGVSDVAILVDGVLVEFSYAEHDTYYVLAVSYAPGRHEIIIHLRGMLDEDGDGLANYEEFLKGTDPRNADTDGDLWGDAVDPWPLNPAMPTTAVAVPAVAALGAAIALRRRAR